MDSPLYRYKFADRVGLPDVEDSLLLAALAVEGICGESRVRMDFRYAMDRGIRTIVVNASTPVGQMVNSVFAAFVLREFGRDAFDVRRVEEPPRRSRQEGGQ